jgi:hypothetical protein
MSKSSSNLLASFKHNSANIDLRIVIFRALLRVSLVHRPWLQRWGKPIHPPIRLSFGRFLLQIHPNTTCTSRIVAPGIRIPMRPQVPIVLCRHSSRTRTWKGLLLVRCLKVSLRHSMSYALRAAHALFSPKHRRRVYSYLVWIKVRAR